MREHPGWVDELKFGGEHSVSIRKFGDRIDKFTGGANTPPCGMSIRSANNGKVAGTRLAFPSEYLLRLYYQIELLGDDVVWESCTPHGEFHISQVFQMGDSPGETEIGMYFRTQGFRRIGAGVWEHRDIGIVVADAHPRNFKKSDSDRVTPIDVIIAEIPHTP